MITKSFYCIILKYWPLPNPDMVELPDSGIMVKVLYENLPENYNGLGITSHNKAQYFKVKAEIMK